MTDDLMELGTLRDPQTGAPVTVTGEVDLPELPYRKWRGGFGSCLTPEAIAAWPATGLHWLTFSNGRRFAEVHMDRDGWWQSPDCCYMPHRRLGPVAQFFVQLGAGLHNGYPVRDVVIFAARGSIGYSRLPGALRGRIGLP